MWSKTPTRRGGAVNIAHPICIGHLPDPWGQRWREGAVGGELYARSKRLVVFRSWLIEAYNFFLFLFCRS